MRSASSGYGAGTHLDQETSMSDHGSEPTPPIYANDDVPPDMEIKAHPVRVAVGALAPDAAVDDVARLLVAEGVAEDRIHFFCGDEGREFLDNLGNWFTRAMSEP